MSLFHKGYHILAGPHLACLNLCREFSPHCSLNFQGADVREQPVAVLPEVHSSIDCTVVATLPVALSCRNYSCRQLAQALCVRVLADGTFKTHMQVAKNGF